MTGIYKGTVRSWSLAENVTYTVDHLSYLPNASILDYSRLYHPTRSDTKSLTN
jgi:hypothetical protein